MKTYRKGRKAELEFVKKLEVQGYKVITAPKGNRFSKQKDLFDHWDLCAYKPEKTLNEAAQIPGHWLLVQVKSNDTGGVLRKLQNVARELPKGTRAILAVRKDGVGAIKARWVEYDLRKEGLN